MSRLLLLVGLALGLMPGTATSQLPPEAPRYQVYLLTIDQGEEVWEKFGHNAILIRDGATGEDLAWNWGLFNFEDVDFLPRFLRGTMRYSMGPAELDPFVGAYAMANRTVYANEVFLSQEEAAELDAFVRWNYLPENRPYIYHYFQDNCSTRVRDALDGVLGGLLRDTFAGRTTPWSYRWHTRRLVQGTTWIDQGLSYLLGMRGDLPRTQWEAMFIPMELMALLEEVERTDGAGAPTPLLGPRQVLFEADRPSTPAGPPAFSPIWVILGLAGAGGILALGVGAERGRRGATAGALAGVAAWGAFSGLLGTLLLSAWLTDHDFIQWNLNLFHTSPLGLPLAGLAVGILARRRWREGAAGRALALIAVGVAGISVGAALLQVTPFVSQGNGEVLAVALPLNLATAWVLARSAFGAGTQPAPARMSSA